MSGAANLRPQRPDRKQIGLRVPIPVYQVLRRMAFEEERTIQSFLMEGVDWVLARHGQPSAAEIVAESEGK